MSLSRFLPFFSGFDPDRPTRSAQRGAIFWVGNSVRPTHSAQTWDAESTFIQLRIPSSSPCVGGCCENGIDFSILRPRGHVVIVMHTPVRLKFTRV